MKSADLKSGKVLRGPIFSEPVQIMVATAMGEAMKIFGTERASCSIAARPNPSLNILSDPATLDCQPVVKIEHYWVQQDSLKHPVKLKEDAIPYHT